MKAIQLLLLTLLISSCSIPMRSTESKITVKELHDHISYLASDELEGRKPGTPQGKMAADYIAAHYASLGLTPLGENGYQYFEVITSVRLGEANAFRSGDIMGNPGTDYTPAVFSRNGEYEAPVTFVDYGFQINTDSLNWDSYADLDVEGHWVIVLRGTPEPEAKSSKFDNYADLRTKLLIARDNGAAGVIFVSVPKFDESDELMDLRIDRNFSQASLPVLHIQRPLADLLFSSAQKNVADLESQLIQEQQPTGFALNNKLNVTVDVIQEEVTTQNIVAMLPGSDPVLKDEIILIGAHYDHLGWGGKGSGSRRPDTTAIHNGADDNASGTAAVLEIAERFALSNDIPRRSIVFMAFGAEEMGLLGSKFFTKNPLIDLSAVKQMFNLDMVGRLNPARPNLTIGGTGTANGIEDLLKDLGADRPFMVSMTPDGYGPSDHASFYVEDIPVLFFFTGITEEYHTPDDDIETLNLDGEKQIADFAYDIIREISAMEKTYDYQEAGPKSAPKTGKRGKVKMGIIPEFASASSSGFLIGGVVAGGPAAMAGMKKGDVMIALDGRSVMNVYDYMGRMAEVKPGQRITVEVMRGEEKLILIVEV